MITYVQRGAFVFTILRWGWTEVLAWAWRGSGRACEGGGEVVNYHVRSINDLLHLHLFEKRSHKQYLPLIFLDTNTQRHVEALRKYRPLQRCSKIKTFTWKQINVCSMRWQREQNQSLRLIRIKKQLHVGNKACISHKPLLQKRQGPEGGVRPDPAPPTWPTKKHTALSLHSRMSAFSLSML